MKSSHRLEWLGKTAEHGFQKIRELVLVISPWPWQIRDDERGHALRCCNVGVDRDVCKADRKHEFGQHAAQHPIVGRLVTGITKEQAMASSIQRSPVRLIGGPGAGAGASSSGPSKAACLAPHRPE